MFDNVEDMDLYRDGEGLLEQCRQATQAQFGYDASDGVCITMTSDRGPAARIDWKMVGYLERKYGEYIDADYELEWEDGDLDIQVPDWLYQQVLKSPIWTWMLLRMDRLK